MPADRKRNRGYREGRRLISERLEIRLIDEAEPEDNPNLNFALTDTADAVAAFRAEGRNVFLHCVQAQSRTPTVASLYAARHLGVPIDRALAEVCAVLPNPHPNAGFLAALWDVGGMLGASHQRAHQRVHE